MSIHPLTRNRAETDETSQGNLPLLSQLIYRFQDMMLGNDE